MGGKYQRFEIKRKLRRLKKRKILAKYRVTNLIQSENFELSI